MITTHTQPACDLDSAALDRIYAEVYGYEATGYVRARIEIADAYAMIAAARAAQAPQGDTRQGAPAWGPVETVADMVRNLLTLDQAAPIYAAFHVDIAGERRCRTKPVTISRERVIDGKWVDSKRKDVPYAMIVWAKPDEAAHTCTLADERALADQFAELAAKAETLRQAEQNPNLERIHLGMRDAFHIAEQRARAAQGAGTVPVEAEEGVRGPLTEAQRNDCRALAATLHGGRHGDFDEVIRRASVAGYMNGRHDFAPVSTAAATTVSASDDAVIVWVHPDVKLKRDKLTNYCDEIVITGTSVKFGSNTWPMVFAPAPSRAADGQQGANFCARCGKRLGDGIYTCTPPAAGQQGASREALDGWNIYFPSNSPESIVVSKAGEGFVTLRSDVDDPTETVLYRYFAALARAPLPGQDDVQDAARWRAFVGSARIKPQGCAGVNEEQPNHYAHMGLEIWTTYPRDFKPELLEQMDKSTALGRDWLTKYADVAVRAAQSRAQSDTTGESNA